jgi:hypothetical protein
MRLPVDVIDGISDRRSDADQADALDSQQIDDVIRSVDEDHLEIVHVGIHRHVILAEIGVNDAAEVDRSASPPVPCRCPIPRTLPMIWSYDAVLVLRMRPAAGRADDAGDPDHAELLVHFSFGEYTGMRISCIR